MEKKEMSANKKLTIAISALLLAILCVVGTLIAVYAAAWQGVKSAFTVKYQIGNNIAVKTEVYYQYEDGESTKAGELSFHTDGGITDADGNETEDTSITIPDLNLTTDSSMAVRLIYVFTNIGANSFSLATTWNALNYLDDTDTTNNKNIYLNVASYQTTAADSDKIANNVPTEFDKTNEIDDPSVIADSVISTDEVFIAVITISVADQNQNAYCHSSTDGLTFSLNHTTATN